MFAVFKAGGAFVPLDPSHPVERLRSLCESVGARLMLCSSHLVEKVEGIVDTVLPLGDSTMVNATQAETESITSASSTNAAYVIFTSGSTGKPKVCIASSLKVLELIMLTLP
jgi:non-ribosomal peptide synthetase component F